MIPKPFIYLTVILLTLLLLPPVIIARFRAMPSDKPRVHIIQNMDNMSRFKAQQASPLFLDGRAMRPPMDGTVARGELVEDEHKRLGWSGDAWATTLPEGLDPDMRLMERGRERFGIYCSICHGIAGYGDGIVHQRADALLSNPTIANGTTWVQPKNIHDPEVRVQPIGQIYSSITNGIRNMAGYASQIPIEDRWAIAFYVKALQRSQNAAPGDLGGGAIDDLPLIDLSAEGGAP